MINKKKKDIFKSFSQISSQFPMREKERKIEIKINPRREKKLFTREIKFFYRQMCCAHRIVQKDKKYIIIMEKEVHTQT